MNYYPDQIRAILVYIDALDEAEKKVGQIKEKGIGLPYLEKIRLLDVDGAEYGWLVDEIGGSWSWLPKGAKA